MMYFKYIKMLGVYLRGDGDTHIWLTSWRGGGDYRQ